ncbi:acyl-coenzyme A thioesterase 13-like [Chenopodium quinoa]|uniref:Thioesterase domain-containing protein n=1 Tax=Chenopodium quinoa TaxID=63459 RepID=A0A803M3F8_CHEQI|nr:acyl-coenzyme A thioesterase 13-like [Chenopodium quinoa]
MDDSKKKVDHQHEQQVALDEAAANNALKFFEQLGSSLESLPLNTNGHDYMSQLMLRFLKVDSISRGRVTCSFSVLPPFVNYYEGLQGGVVATVAERLATACARTMVGEEKPLFLGEQSISYLSAASMNAELVADGKVLRSGRNLTVASVEIKLKETKKLLYISQATFYHLPISKL